MTLAADVARAYSDLGQAHISNTVPAKQEEHYHLLFSAIDDLSPQQWSALGLYFCRKAAEWDAGLRGKVRAIEIAIFVQAVDERWSPDLAPTQQRTLPCDVADR